MEEKTELSLGKITVKFAIKFIMWSLLFFVIGCVVVFMTFGQSITNVDEDDLEAMISALKCFIYALAIVDVVAALLATKLSVGGITKKQKITEENKPVILKRIGIVMIVIALIVLIIHGLIVGMVKKITLEEIGDDYDSISELIDEAEDELENEDYSIFDEDEIEIAIDGLKAINFAGNVYVIVGLVYVAMIPVANVLLKKKIEK